MALTVINASGFALAGVCGVWEWRRKKILATFNDAKQHYVDSGSDSRYPFYGRSHGYEIDYMIEFGVR